MQFYIFLSLFLLKSFFQAILKLQTSKTDITLTVTLNSMKLDQMHEGFGGTLWSWIFFKKWDIFSSVRSIALCYAISAIFFGVLAVTTTIIFIPLQDHKIKYADFNGCLTNTINPSKDHNSISHRCQVTFQIPKQMSPPIHFLYFIENAYINHRGYLSSYSKNQLQGQIISQKEAKMQCSPFIYNKDIGRNVSWSGKPLDPEAIANPCGFKPFLFFNDTFKLSKVQQKKNTQIKIDESKIVQIQGLGRNFKSRNADQEWINPEDGHFKMWMQTQSLMTKQKLWGVIQQSLMPGNYSILIENNYKINNMRIAKGIRIEQASNLGGKSYFIPIFFLLTALGCLIFAIVFYKKFKSFDQKKRHD